MEGKKIYRQSMGTVLDAINDIVELQNGKLTYSDTLHGRIDFTIEMYGFKWELSFSIADAGNNRSGVSIEVGGEIRGKEDLIRREFALLDSMLAQGTQIEIMENNEE